MKRLTLRLPDELYRSLRIQAAHADTSVHQLAIDRLSGKSIPGKDLAEQAEDSTGEIEETGDRTAAERSPTCVIPDTDADDSRKG